METYEIEAWLGDTEITDEQRVALRQAADDLTGRWDDDPDPDREAMTGAAQLILGDATPASLAAEWRQAQRALDEAHARMTGGIVAYYAASTELATAEAFGVTRQTVRKALGR